MSVIQDLLQQIETGIDQAKLNDSFQKKGEILELKDGVATVTGLDEVKSSEIVLFENGVKGLVLDLTTDGAGVLVLGDYSSLKQGDTVTATGEVFKVGVGEEYLGRVVNGVGMPIDGGKEIKPEHFGLVERVAPGVITRKEVNVPLETGIKSIDAMIPIGRGQRELIIGDRQTGKTTIATDTILNQKGRDVYCIYVAIGQKDSKVRRTVEMLKEKGAMDYTIVVNASISSPAVIQYLAPYVGCAMGEYFMEHGKDALIIYDDLSKHAVAYREISLLLKRPPAREAYPGDVFYLHSRLLERAARVDQQWGGGSLTALPIIETLGGDIAAYIPTNVISITDGQIFLESDLFNSGFKPAVNVGLSVSRVGGSAQTKIMKKVSGNLKLQLATYRELASFSQFASDLDPATRRKLDNGAKLMEMLKQTNDSPIPFFKQVVLVYAGIHDYFEKAPLEGIAKIEKMIYQKLDSSYLELANKIQEEKALTPEIEEEMKNLISEVITELGYN
ncbi:F0F1 ATP synthase subunit alpha [bacterium]|nr:F0F1 ATP synthase subunit alpha [bacterium]